MPVLYILWPLSHNSFLLPSFNSFRHLFPIHQICANLQKAFQILAAKFNAKLFVWVVLSSTWWFWNIFYVLNRHSWRRCFPLVLLDALYMVVELWCQMKWNKTPYNSQQWKVKICSSFDKSLFPQFVLQAGLYNKSFLFNSFSCIFHCIYKYLGPGGNFKYQLNQSNRYNIEHQRYSYWGGLWFQPVCW